MSEGTRRQQRLRPVDAVLPLVVWAWAVLVTLLAPREAAVGSGVGTLTVLLLIASAESLPLLWRRVHPVAVFAMVSLAALLSAVVFRAFAPGDIGFPLALYALAAHAREEWARRAGLVVVVAGAVVATVAWPRPAVMTPVSTVTGVLILSLAGFVVWLWGNATRNRGLLVDGLQARAESLERERDQLTLIASQEERARIAREMHDVVAHSLAVIVVQADGAAYAARHGSTWTPTDAAAALDTIGGTAREALRDTRSLMGVLRSDGDDATYDPTRSLDDIPALVSGVRDSGHEVVLWVDPELADVRRDVALAAYRIVQEGLTNVLKHAGPQARSAVEVRHAGDDLVVSVTDDGRGASADGDGEGHGLVGLRERARAVGGSVQVGPVTGGGYAVRVTLPLGDRP